MAAKKTSKKPAMKVATKIAKVAKKIAKVATKTARVVKTAKARTARTARPKNPKNPKNPKKEVSRSPARGRASKASDALGHTLLRAVTVAIVSDGEIGAEEEKMLARFLKAPLFAGLDGPAIVEATIRECVDHGPDAIYADVASKLTTKEAREAAFSSCLAATVSDGKITASEARMLHALKDAFSLSTARARSLAGPAAAVFR